MATTTIANLFTPAIWVPAVREAAEKQPVIFNSKMVRRGPMFDEIASGPGTSANIPTWLDITDGSQEEVQVESTAPSTNNITTGTQICTPLNRVAKYGASALSAQISGGDPVAEIASQLALWRMKRRQGALVATLRGVFGTGAQTPGQAQGAARATRNDIFLEAGASPAAGQLISSNAVIDTVSLMGELGKNLSEGAVYMHSAIRSALMKIDAASFKQVAPGVESGLPFLIETYRGIPVFVSDDLVRAGATSGFVYDTYFAANGVIGFGEKPQVLDDWNTIDVASLQFYANKDTNDAFLYDRTRYLIHVNGVKWVGSPAGSSATNAELQTYSNWNLVYQSARRTGIACLRTNG